MNSPIKIPEEIKSKVYEEFKRLPFEAKLVVFARLKHGNTFRAQDNDLLGLTRRSASRIYRTFIESLRNDASKESQTIEVEPCSEGSSSDTNTTANEDSDTRDCEKNQKEEDQEHKQANNNPDNSGVK